MTADSQKFVPQLPLARNEFSMMLRVGENQFTDIRDLLKEIHLLTPDCMNSSDQLKGEAQGQSDERAKGHHRVLPL